MKIISLEKTKDYIYGFYETDDHYQAFTVDRTDHIEQTESYKKDEYRSYEHFVGVMSKFGPFTFFFKTPIEVDSLSFQDLSILQTPS
jgi:hypothetical protein